MQTIKKPWLMSASVLSLALALSACSTTSMQPNHADSRGMPHGEGDRGHDWGRGGDHDHDDDMGGMHRRMADLNLSDAQKAQIQQLHEQQKVQHQQLKATLAQYDATIAQQRQAGASSDALLNLYKQKQAAMQQAFALHQQEQQQFMNILTPDQQLKLYQGREARMR